MKAITPVIALVMLLLITVGIVGASYTWFGGLMSSQTKKSITIPPGGAYCADGDIKVYVLNNGDTTLTSSDITVAQVDGVDVKGTPFFGDMRSGLVGYWKFDEASGATAKDSSGVTPPNDGTLNGNPQRVVGKSRNALKFDPSDGSDYIEISDDPMDMGVNSFTIEGWIKPVTLTTNGNVFRKFASSKGYEMILLSNGAVDCRVADGTLDREAITAANSIIAGKWYYVTCVYDKTSKVRAYIDGVSKATNDISTVGNVDNAIALRIGGASVYFSGLVDEMKIYKKIVGGVNIQPSASGLVMNYPGLDGRHTVRIGTSSGAAEATITC